MRLVFNFLLTGVAFALPTQTDTAGISDVTTIFITTEDSVESGRTSATTVSTTTEPAIEEPIDEGLSFEQVADIIRLPDHVISNLDEHPFIAEHKAFELLNKMKEFVWISSNMENKCVEDSCAMEEMSENLEPEDSKARKLTTKTFQKYQACFNSLHGIDDHDSAPKTKEQQRIISDKVRKQCLPSTWTNIGVPILAAGTDKQFSFQQIVNMVKYPKDILNDEKSLIQNPFIAENQAFDILKKVRGLQWSHNPRDRALLHSDIESCNEEQCTHEEMNEDFENDHWNTAEKYSGKIPIESFQKYKACFESIRNDGGIPGENFRNKIRKQCLPYEWNIVGLPMNLEDESGGFFGK